MKACIQDIGCMVKSSDNKGVRVGLASTTRGHAIHMACLPQACRSLNLTKASKIHSRILHMPAFFMRLFIECINNDVFNFISLPNLVGKQGLHC